MDTQIIPIDDPHDPAIAAYRNLKDRDLRALSGEDAHHGCFVIEGLTVVEKALAGPLYPVLSLLIAEKRLDRVVPLATGSAFAGPVYAASGETLDSIAGFPMHRGVLGLGARPQPIAADRLVEDRLVENRLGAKADARFLVLSGIANHDNMGGLFRNAAAFGVDAVVMDGACCDPLYRKAIRVSVGGSLLVPFARQEGIATIVDALQARGVRCIALAVDGPAKLTDIIADRDRPTALLVGAEGSGLADDIVSRCESVCIPMRGQFDSLNVSTAAGIALHWLSAAT